MKFTRLIAALLLAAATAIAAAPILEAAVPTATFGSRPIMGSPRISPNGKYVAIPGRSGGKLIISILDIDANDIAPVAELGSSDAEKGVRISWIEWGNDDRIIVSVETPVPYTYRGVSYTYWRTRTLAMDRDGGNQKVLFGRNRGGSTGIGIAHMLPSDNEHVLMPADGKQKSGSGFFNQGSADFGELSLFKVNIYTGSATLVAGGRQGTVDWQTDQAGNPRVRTDYDYVHKHYEIYGRPADKDSWTKIGQYGQDTFAEFSVLGFADDGRNAIVSTRNGRDKAGIYEFDIAARRVVRTIYENPNYDVAAPLSGIGRILADHETGKLIGVRYVDDYVQSEYFEPELNAIQAMLDRSFSTSSNVAIVSVSRDRSRVVFFTESPKDVGTYRVLDVKAKQLTDIGTLYPNIPTSELGDVRIIKYPSRDGTSLPGYLTLPPGKGTKNLPLVVMPHGGPEVRDYVQYDAWAQLLANRGYAVFQPNFRGSGGYGRAFTEAGHEQWGRRMQDDVTDGVKALIADGTVNAGRICIVGASYGGYAALAGGALTPELYKCVVSIAGVADLMEMLSQEKSDGGADSFAYRLWVKRIGDPASESAAIIAVSPAQQAARFTAPVLLVHGAEDSVVPIKHSQIMERALKSAGKSVRLVTIPGEGHSFTRDNQSMTKLLTEVEAFVAANIGQ